MKVLVTGGSGYLGQFVVSHLRSEHEVSFTFLNADGVNDPRGFKVNFETGEGLKECLDQVKDLDVVVNCAAISQIKFCEEQKDRATKINVPTQLMQKLKEIYPDKAKHPLFIHISSDQVYDGKKSAWTENDPCNPVNHYGVTKVQAEEAIKAQWSKYVVLRSSLIYGKKCEQPPISSRFLDFVIQSLKSENPTSFFSDEYRCPVYADDIAKIISLFISKSKDQSFHHVFNMGGPERLSRADMAQKVQLCFDSLVLNLVDCNLSRTGCIQGPFNRKRINQEELLQSIRYLNEK